MNLEEALTALPGLTTDDDPRVAVLATLIVDLLSDREARRQAEGAMHRAFAPRSDHG